MFNYSVKTKVQMQGTDGNWYSPFGGFPRGVSWNGEKRIAGYVLHNGSHTVGMAYPTIEEANAALELRRKEHDEYTAIMQAARS